MAFIDSIREKAKLNRKHILLPEGSESRTLRAAACIAGCRSAGQAAINSGMLSNAQ